MSDIPPPSERASRRRRLLASFGTRAVLVSCATALSAVLVTAAVALPVTVRETNNEIRQSLDEKAALAADVLTGLTAPGKRSVIDRLRREGFTVYFIRQGVVDQTGLPPPVVTQVADGVPLARPATVDGEEVKFSGRPLPMRGNGVVLTHPPIRGAATLLLGDLWIALVAGLLAGVAAGALLAGLVTRPVRRAAAAATLLSTGERDIRLPVRPPTEVAELATAFNDLAAALAASEDRQRDFLLSVSHDLRTPLTTIQGYAEALADGTLGGESVPHAGRTVVAEAQRLDRFIADLLVLARLEAADLPLDMGPTDLAELAASAGDAWRPRCAAEGLDLRTEVPAGPVLVSTDPGRIRQVIDGLCDNALRVVPAGAPLVLAVRATPTGGVIEVRDGGSGFTDGDLAVAFETGALYQRYRGIRPVGSGLGLALAGRLVHRLGGTIEAGHAAEGGARFTINLPRTSPAAP